MDNLETLAVNNPAAARYEKMLLDAIDMAKTAKSKAQSTSVGEKLKNAIINNANDIQNIIDKIMSADEKYSAQAFDKLDEKVRIAKLQLLEEKSRDTATTYTIIIVGSILAVAAFLYFTKPKTPAVK